MTKRNASIDRSRAATKQRLARALSEIGFVLPGSLMRRFTYCGKPGCKCQADPPQPHGPYWVWTRKVAGKTVTKMLTDDQAQRYKQWFKDWAKLRALVDELQALSLETAAEAEGWEKR